MGTQGGANYDELELLEHDIKRIEAQARKFNLDFFPMRFEVVPADVIYAVGAYGMPTRFAYWGFGKGFQRLKTQYDYNLSRIYELVINTNPCWAFLLEGNSLIQQKLVISHVFAHSDFFKNNARFSLTSRQMVDVMAVHAGRLRDYEARYGRREVEIILDAALAVAEQIEPPGFVREPPATERKRGEPAAGVEEPTSPYDDLWSLDRRGRRSGSADGDSVKEGNAWPPGGKKATDAPEQGQLTRGRRLSEKPVRNLVRFLAQNSLELEDWQRDCLAMMEEEMAYFRPQMETKLMNEGWAAYWHSRILRELDLNEEETMEYSKMHANVLATSRFQINPYYVGLRIFEDIEKRWDNPSAEDRKKFGRQPGQGREKIFEVRATEIDISFLRNYLTRELVEELDLYLYQRVGHDWVVVEKDWEKVRDGLVASMVNCGLPVLQVEDGDYEHRGEIYLRHLHEGRDLDLPYLEKTLPYVYLLWGRPVHLETLVDGKPVLFFYDGKKSSRRSLSKPS